MAIDEADAQYSDLVVIGGGAAGMSAASRARRLQPHWTITVFERTSWVSFILCGLPYYVDGLVPDLQQLVAYPPQFFERERRIRMRLHHQVEMIDPQEQVLAVKDLTSGRQFSHRYGKLVLAMGAHALRPSLPGLDLANVFVLHSMDDGWAMRAVLQGGGLERGAIVGAGYVGLEMAEALRQSGLEVLLLEALSQVLPGAEPEVAALVEQELLRHGVVVRKSDTVSALLGDGRVTALRTSAGEYPVDFVLLSVGIRPSVSLAQEAGIALGPSGAVAVNDRLETSAPNVYAAGDVAEAWHLLLGRPAWVPLGTTANKQGRIAGENAAGGDARFAGIVGTAAFKVFDLEVARTGLTEAEARAQGFDPIATTVRHRSRARYYPGSSELVLKLVADKRTGKALGGQMVGREGAAKRIDVLATALHAGMTVADLIGLDLSYAPPFATVWEAVQIAARQLQPLASEGPGATSDV